MESGRREWGRSRGMPTSKPSDGTWGNACNSTNIRRIRLNKRVGCGRDREGGDIIRTVPTREGE